MTPQKERSYQSLLAAIYEYFILLLSQAYPEQRLFTRAYFDFDEESLHANVHDLISQMESPQKSQAKGNHKVAKEVSSQFNLMKQVMSDYSEVTHLLQQYKGLKPQQVEDWREKNRDFLHNIEQKERQYAELL